MLAKAELRLAGDDDSGPEDALDDLDLECERVLRLKIQLPKYSPGARHTTSTLVVKKGLKAEETRPSLIL